MRETFCRVAFLLCVFGGQTLAQVDPPAPYGVVPEPRQLDWHGLEYYAFLHFGPNTFNNEEWGWTQSPPDIFNPSSLDTDQWARELRDAGMTMMILTAKHHDGMALWDTATTQYKITNSAWAANRAEAGLDADVVRMAAQSAEKYGLKFGVYLSPWDMHMDPAVEKDHLAGTIYDEPEVFGDQTPGEYNDYFARQLVELLTMKIDNGSGGQKQIQIAEVWLDGASGTQTRQTFDWARFRGLIRRNQPNAIMWGHQGVDARWVGNEEGTTRRTNWHTLDVTQDDARYDGPRLEVGDRNGTYWTPAESDARLRDGWFFHPGERVKPADELFAMYLNTVGRSVNLLLDVPPDTTGKLAEEDLAALRAFREKLERFLDRNVIGIQTTATASAVRGGDGERFGPALAIDGDSATYWAMDDGSLTGYIDIDLGGLYDIDAIVVQEHIALGQRIGGYEIQFEVDDDLIRVVQGTSVGYQHIDVLEHSVRTSRVRFVVTQADAVPLITTIVALGAAVPAAQAGDTDLDGDVDDFDMIAAIENYTGSLEPGVGEKRAADGDTDSDRDVDDFDLINLITGYTGSL